MFPQKWTLFSYQKKTKIEKKERNAAARLATILATR